MSYEGMQCVLMDDTPFLVLLASRRQLGAHVLHEYMTFAFSAAVQC